jgi:hypothetical protein
MKNPKNPSRVLHQGAKKKAVPLHTMEALGGEEV